MTHCRTAGAPRTLCGIKASEPAALPLCGPPRFVRRLDHDAPHCPVCIAALQVLPAPDGSSWTQLELPL